MDLAELDTADLASQGMVMHVHSAAGPVFVTGEDGKLTDEPVTITLLGDDSDVMVQFDRDTFDQGMKGSAPVTAAAIEAKAINRIAKATVGWSGIVLDGEKVPYSEANAKMLYRRLRWLRFGAQQFVSDRANFMKASAGR